MIESMVGISLVMIGLLGVMTLLIRSSQWNRDVTMKLQAAYLAAEGIEIVKNKIDSNIATMLSEGGASWNDGFTVPDNEYEVTSEGGAIREFAARPLRYDAARGYGYDSGEEGVFTRKVVVLPLGGGDDPVRVRAEVSWGSGKKVVLEDIFTFWRKQGEKP